MNHTPPHCRRRHAGAPLALATLTIMGLSACVNLAPAVPPTAQAQGVGGTGIRQACAGGAPRWNPGGSGIGGTGHTGTPDRGRRAHQGVGGAGQQAESGLGGTGIVGIVTGFASLCVDGVEVHYQPDTPVKIDGQPAGVEALRVGHFVATLAAPGPNGLQAKVIMANHSLVGAIEAVDARQRRIRLLGTEVELPPEVILADADGRPLRLAQLQAGDPVAVSGLWKPGNVVAATRVDRLSALPQAVALGPIRLAGDQRFTVAGIPAQAVQAESLGPRLVGHTAMVFGHWNGERLLADRIKPLPTVPFAGKAQRLTLEGYVTQTMGSDRFRLLGSVVVELAPDSKLLGDKPLRKGARVWVTGRVTPEQHLLATQVQVLE